MDRVKIRRWKRGDLEQIVDLWLELTYHINPTDGFYRIAPDARRKYRGYLNRVFGDRNYGVFVADSNERLVGFVMGRVNQTPSVVIPDMVGYIENIFIEKESRRSGVGRELCHSLFEWFKERRIGHVELFYQIENTEAAAFWKRLGFRTWLAKAYRGI
jgi:ribosomal protein S18 acetylase RimI-like enzyme